MPHLTLEYSGNLADLDVEQYLLELNRTLVASGEFEEIDIKSRALRFDHFVIGTAPEQRAFIHAKVAILQGRSPEVRRALSGRLLERLQQLCHGASRHQTQLCVEILEIERDSYAKSIAGG